MCKVWKIEPHNTEPLARRKTSTKGQRTIIQKGVEILRKQKEIGPKRKGQSKRKGGVNVLDITDLPELSITSSESINFSCYEMSEKVEWFLDSGCTDHITPRKRNFVQYRELGQAHNAKIADGKYCKIKGCGTVVGHSIMLDGMASLQIETTLICSRGE